MKILPGKQKSTDITISGFVMLMIGLLLVPMRGFAETGAEPSSEPVNKKLHITSDKLVSNQNELYITFTGHVKAIHGSKTVNSDHLRIFYSKNDDGKTGPGEKNIKKIVATGNVTIELSEGIAECDRAVYLTKTKTITLTGKNTRIQKEKNFITGKKIIIHQDTGQIIVDGSSDTRVNAVFQPETDSQYFDLK